MFHTIVLLLQLKNILCYIYINNICTIFLKLIQKNFNFDHVDHSNFIITDLWWIEQSHSPPRQELGRKARGVEMCGV